MIVARFGSSWSISASFYYLFIGFLVFLFPTTGH